MCRFECALACAAACLMIAGGCVSPERRDADAAPERRATPAAPVARPEAQASQRPAPAERSLAGAGRGSPVEAPVAPPPALSPVAAAPLEYLRQVHRRCAELEQYTLTFTRQERRGFLRSMQGPERIACWYRRTPFSIRMKWLDETVKYGESSYVAGWFDDKVRFIPRWGFLGLQPTLTRVSLNTPVVFGEARYPVTNFGVERVMERLLATFDAAGGAGTIVYEGLVELDEPRCAAHKFVVTVPDALSETPTSEVFVDAGTDLLVALRLYSRPERLECYYAYVDLNADVALSDADFLLPGETLAEARAWDAAPSDAREGGAAADSAVPGE